MRQLNLDTPFETPEQWRKRSIAETCRFIEWGLAHPEKVEWIPRHPVGHEVFSERMKSIFWSLIAQTQEPPDN